MSVIPNSRTEKGLVGDCEVLLGIRDTLAGTSTLNWGLNVPISDWDGVDARGTPQRVTQIALDYHGLSGELPDELGSLSVLETLTLGNNDLTGSIPPGLANLSSLTNLWLPRNRLGGSIPPELGGMSNLLYLSLTQNRLSGYIPGELGELDRLRVLLLNHNDLTGCVPADLSAIELNDIESLGLPECTEGTVSAPSGLQVVAADDEFTLSWSTVGGAGLYDVQHRPDPEGGWMVVGTMTVTTLGHTPSGGIRCGTTHGFRVRAHGDAETHEYAWGSWSDERVVMTDACNRAPEFRESTYSFTVSEDVPTSTTVGSVSAVDPDGDVLSYSFTAGNGAGLFDIGGDTGEITVTGALDHETAQSHVLTVEAGDGRGGTATATVNIDVTDVPEDPPPAPTGLRASRR